MNKKGFSLIEILVALGLFASVCLAMGIKANLRFHKESLTQKPNSQVRCIEGYKFFQNKGTSLKQIVDDKGRGLKCDDVPETFSP